MHLVRSEQLPIDRGRGLDPEPIRESDESHESAVGEPIGERKPQVEIDGEALVRRLDEVASPDASDFSRELALTLVRDRSPLGFGPISPHALGFRDGDMFDDGVREDDVELLIVEWQGRPFLKQNELQSHRAAFLGEVDDVCQP